MKTLLLLLALITIGFSQLSHIHLFASTRIQGTPNGNCSLYTVEIQSGTITSQKIFPVICAVLETDTIFRGSKFYHHSKSDIHVLDTTNMNELSSKRLNSRLERYFGIGVDRNDQLVSLGSYSEELSLFATNAKTGEIRKIMETTFKGVVPQRLVVHPVTRSGFYTTPRSIVTVNIDTGAVERVINKTNPGPLSSAFHMTPTSCYTIEHGRRFTLSVVDFATGISKPVVEYPENFVLDRYSAMQKTFVHNKNFHYALLTEKQTSKLFLAVTNVLDRKTQIVPFSNLDWERVIPLAIGN